MIVSTFQPSSSDYKANKYIVSILNISCLASYHYRSVEDDHNEETEKLKNSFNQQVNACVS